MSKAMLTLAFLAMLIKIISSTGKLSIKLLHFENTQGRLPNGVCCDGIRRGTSTCNSCEYYFIICISAPTGGRCSLMNIWTTDIGYDNYFLFPASFQTIPHYTRISNPMQFTFNQWQARVSVSVNVYDDDNGISEYGHPMNDHVTSMTQNNISIPAYSNEAVVVKTRLLLSGQPRRGIVPKMTMEISAICDSGYLIPSCAEHCVDTDGDTGHFRCNFANGTRDCLSGWHGDRCLQRRLSCAPRNDNLGHFSCHPVTGQKICLAGWKDPASNCTQADIATSFISPTISSSASLLPCGSSQTQNSQITHTASQRIIKPTASQSNAIRVIPTRSKMHSVYQTKNLESPSVVYPTSTIDTQKASEMKRNKLLSSSSKTFRTKLKVVEDVDKSIDISGWSAEISATQSLTQTSSILRRDVNEKTSPKASFNVKKIAGILAALLVLAMLVIVMTISVSRKNRQRKVQPFKHRQTHSSSTGGDQDEVFSSRNSLRSIQSMQQVTTMQQKITALQTNSNNIIAMSAKTRHDHLPHSTQQYLVIPNGNWQRGVVETNIDSTMTENRASKVAYEDNFIPPPLEYVKKKAIAL
eukprot:gene18733-20622_t